MMILDKEDLESYKSLLKKYQDEDFSSERENIEFQIEIDMFQHMHSNELANDLLIKKEDIKSNDTKTDICKNFALQPNYLDIINKQKSDHTLDYSHLLNGCIKCLNDDITILTR